jgi:hypothetical protein
MAAAISPAHSVKSPSWPAEPTPFLGECDRRIAKRRGKKRAMVALGRSLLVITWHLLANDDLTFIGLRRDHFTKHLNPDRQKPNHIANWKPSATPSPSPQPPKPPRGRSPHSRIRCCGAARAHRRTDSSLRWSCRSGSRWVATRSQ